MKILLLTVVKGVGRKISTGGHRKKDQNSKKDRKIALLSLFKGGGNVKKDQKLAKNTEK